MTEHISLKDLVLCIQEPELGLRRVAANALMQIARHKPELARVVSSHLQKVAADEYALLPFLGPLIQHGDPKLKRQAIACLSHIAFHNQSLAEQVIHYVKFEQLLKNLKDPDLGVKVNTAECINNLVKHKAESAKYICNKDGAKALIEYIRSNPGPAREPALSAISSIAKFDEGLAITIINSDAVPTIRDALINETDNNIKIKAAEALGYLGGHSEDHAKVLADKGVMKELMNIVIKETRKEENRNDKLIQVCKDANMRIINYCKIVSALDALIMTDTIETPKEILILVLRQLVRILPASNQSKRRFAETGGLEKLLRFKEERTGREDSDKTVESIIDEICKQFDKMVVNYFTPNYPMKRMLQEENANPTIE